jgi:hypothetical protein
MHSKCTETVFCTYIHWHVSGVEMLTLRAGIPVIGVTKVS